ncbi:MAG: ThiF family adenylyltransferase [Brachybacterium sp.]|uniref:ThiF family adenylyltransferase n=1 Tax=Brachybacterium sp. TaxID=1891286 RepID=UPI002656379D|nr:ThiF family adenylyltransferase [Brachybacterium sp.]MDN6329179.1 ThiF family adenylyltransferase [Brachybacterium sp.]
MADPGEREGTGPRPDIRACAVDPAPSSVLRDQERYSRQMRLPELGPLGQRRLAASRIAVIGAGGLGAPVLTYLAAAGIGEITLFDPDTVDPTNLHRQVLFTGEDLGRSKAVAAAEHLRALNPETRVRAVVDVITPENALEQLAGHHLVLDGTDNFPTRYLTSDTCELLDIPLVWGSILGFAGQVSVFWGAGGRGVTYRDVHPVPPRPGEVPSCSEAGVLGMLCGVIGSTMAMEAVKVLAGLGDVLYGRLALYDALRARWDELPLARDARRLPVEAIEDVMTTCGLPGPTGPPLGEVTVSELPALLEDGVRVIDIREEHELADGMIRGAEHLPMGAVLALAGADGGTGPQTGGRTGTGATQPRSASAPSDLRDGLGGAVLYCAAGSRSGSVQRSLAAQGIRVRSLRGGFGAVAGTTLVVMPPS